MQILPKKNSHFQSVEYKNFYMLRILSLVFTGLLAGILVFTAIFIYQHIFLAIEQIQSIIIFQNQTSYEVIDFNRFERVQANWEKKHSLDMPEIARDPFNPIIDETGKVKIGEE